MTQWDRIRNMTDEEAAKRLAEYTMFVQCLVRSGRLIKSEEWLRLALLERFRKETEFVKTTED